MRFTPQGHLPDVIIPDKGVSTTHEQSEMANVPTALIVAVPNFLDRQEMSPGKAQQNSVPFSPFFTKMEEKSNLAMQKLN